MKTLAESMDVIKQLRMIHMIWLFSLNSLIILRNVSIFFHPLLKKHHMQILFFKSSGPETTNSRNFFGVGGTHL